SALEKLPSRQLAADRGVEILFANGLFFSAKVHFASFEPTNGLTNKWWIKKSSPAQRPTGSNINANSAVISTNSLFTISARPAEGCGSGYKPGQSGCAATICNRNKNPPNAA